MSKVAVVQSLIWCHCQKKKSWRPFLWKGFSTTTAKPSLQTDEFEKLVLYLFACICYDADSGSGPYYDEFSFLATLMFANVRLCRYESEWKVGLTTLFAHVEFVSWTWVTSLTERLCGVIFKRWEKSSRPNWRQCQQAFDWCYIGHCQWKIRGGMLKVLISI